MALRRPRDEQRAHRGGAEDDERVAMMRAVESRVILNMEEAAAKEGVAPKAVWRNVAKLARSLAVHRQGLWA